MISDSGIYPIPSRVERVVIPHHLGVAPNIVEVDAPEGSQVFTLANQALLIIFPAALEEAVELEWHVGYEAPQETEHEETPEED